MHFIFLTMEATNNGTVAAAATALNERYGTGLRTSVFSLGLHNSPATWRRLEEELPEADFVFGSMLFSEEVVRPLLPLLEPLACPVCIITSNPALVEMTRLGRFTLRKPKESEETAPGLFSKWMGKLKPRHSNGESQRQLALARNVSKVMKHLPGKARDIHTFIAAHQFWLNGSQENLERFLALLIDRYAEGWKGKLPQEDPLFYPDAGIIHPGTDEHFSSPEAFSAWHRKRYGRREKGPVAVLAMRSTVLGGNTRHIERLVELLEERGITGCIAYSGGLDFRPALRRFFTPDTPGSMHPALLINATGFSLVGGPAENRAEEAVAILSEIGVPCLNLVPLSFQPIEGWRESGMGLSPLQTALSVAIPELDGTTEPQVYAGTEAGSDRLVPLEPELHSIMLRIERFLRLRERPPAERRLAIVLFNFPPNLGNAGTAAYLNVFESLHRLLASLRDAGYRVELPPSAEALRERVVEGNRLQLGAEGNVADHLSTDDYRRLFPAYTEIEPFWGDAPGELLTDRDGFRILGCQLGNIFIGQQPPFGYERDPMRLLMAKDAAPNHAFAAFYSWLEHRFDADAVLHFGTHGALEFMPGKQVGLSASCWPKRLIGSLPNWYCYCVNNPSEGAIARRRGMATLLSYLAPPLEEAGLHRELRRLSDLVESWRHHPADELLDELRDLALQAGIEGASDDTPPEAYVSKLAAELYLVAERMIPLGLHVMGRPPEPASLVDHLTLLASHARPELAGCSLHEKVAASLGLDLDRLETELPTSRQAQEAWRRIHSICREAVFLLTGSGRLSGPPPDRQLLEASRTVRIAEADLFVSREAGLKPGSMPRFWAFLDRVLLDLSDNREIDAVLQALDGRYIPPSPGNDLVRNPDIVPTGRNIHSLDPFSIPAEHAVRAGRRSAEELLAAHRREHGANPRSIALVLWGTDNLKSDGEGVAQALALLGARAVRDELGKVADVALIPLEELGRPRIDVVMTLSGIFRDLLTLQGRLLDRAVRLAAEADEPVAMNHVRAHVLQEMQERGCSIEEAACRLYSNAPGSYGANVNHLVESSSWQDEAELAEAFVNRKGFALSRSGEWRENAASLRSALSHVELAFQNIDSAEIGISDIDHYYEYLGGVSKSVEHLSGRKPPVLVGDGSGPGGRQRLRTLEKMVSLEARTRLLNPKWYEAMIAEGYEGVREIESHLSNTFGWSATASAVEGWTYDQFNRTFLQDRSMLQRLAALNPHATMSMTRRLLEAGSRGFWEADESTLDELRELYEELEARAEGAHAETS